ncbi:RagB/SusD family nutrient uptake outer membrane protein [Carboxylicivirga sediminis]|uniref:RagB/SusD family nutrient uptake outer membrane protein n=1 Tax=Carboxylicivirga sediminis TaxID=2006564 RepID=A0A941F448_9BACT|nr:RagB/SusD family nutrient uptake outer membrane protein [Carboxylicivirga sediminis]MBR8535624.1 RagB/SusD family nutrient uptake outer membrane protein [Carboxylicivirga sediminis]
MKNRNIITAFFAGMLLMSSCSLDIEPTDSISSDKAFETIEDLEKGLVGVMGTYGGHGIVGMSDWASDDLRYSLSNTGQGVQVHNWTYNASTGDLSGTWNGNATLVDRANRILEVAERFDAEDEDVKRIKAELVFTRAYAHFEIVRLYCKNYDSNDPLGIPYKYEAGVESPARLPQGVVYKNILGDIDAALPSLPDKAEGSYFATKAAAYALKARVGLYMRNWDLAIEAADKCLETGVRLANRDEYTGVWDDAVTEGVEVIFKLFRENGTLGDYYTRSSNGDIFFHPSYDLMNQYEDGDIRALAFFGKNSGGQDVVIKHDGRPNDKPNVVDLKVFRVSELVLIKAEAYIAKDMLDEAASELNNLRSQRLVNPVLLSFNTAAEAMEALQLERRRELAYEGHRFYDLKRWNLGVSRLDEDSETTAKNLPAGDYRFVFPIPQQEIFANDNMVQNGGYTE